MDCSQSSGKEQESCCLVFPFPTNCEIRRFHFVVVQGRQRNLQIACCTCKVVVLLNLNLLFFCCSRCRRRRRCLSSLIECQFRRTQSKVGTENETE